MQCQYRHFTIWEFKKTNRSNSPQYTIKLNHVTSMQRCTNRTEVTCFTNKVNLDDKLRSWTEHTESCNVPISSDHKFLLLLGVVFQIIWRVIIKVDCWILHNIGGSFWTCTSVNMRIAHILFWNLVYMYNPVINWWLKLLKTKCHKMCGRSLLCRSSAWALLLTENFNQGFNKTAWQTQLSQLLVEKYWWFLYKNKVSEAKHFRYYVTKCLLLLIIIKFH